MHVTWALESAVGLAVPAAGSDWIAVFIAYPFIVTGWLPILVASATDRHRQDCVYGELPEVAMGHLGVNDVRAGLQLLRALGEAIDDTEQFGRRGVELLPRLVASELTTLSVCDLQNGRRSVIGNPGSPIGAEDRAAFDRHFNSHPLVRYHACERGPLTRRISDSVPFARFRHSALYHDYYRRVGIDHAVALPVFVNDRWLVSFVLNRARRDFSDRDWARLDLLRDTVGTLYRKARLIEDLRNIPREPRPGLGAGRVGNLLSDQALARLPLTVRERDVLRWVAAGKTDRDVATILAISPRTVHKHLQRIYDKLGVETRTAAVMRALGASS
jgi:DNA-binding CsgD family transcriptional regulator